MSRPVGPVPLPASDALLAMARPLFADYPLYRTTDQLHVLPVPDRYWRPDAGRQLFWQGPSCGGSLLLQFDRSGAFLVHLSLAPSVRGRGYGEQLYRLAENLARKAGCCEIRQHAQGRTWRGESRIAYVCRRLGYRRLRGEETLVAKAL